MAVIPPNPAGLRIAVNNLIGELKSIFNEPNEMSDWEEIESLILVLHNDGLMEKIQEYMLPYKKDIEDKNLDKMDKIIEKFGSSLPCGKAEYYADLIRNEIEEEDVELIWARLHAMVTVAYKYANRKQKNE